MSVCAWGAGASGALGTGLTQDETTPVVAEGALRGQHIVGVACGEQHSLAVDALGNVYAWGRNREGQCGIGTRTQTVLVPTVVESLAHEHIARVVCGSHQSFALTADGRAYRWGLFHARLETVRPSFVGERVSGGGGRTASAAAALGQSLGGQISAATRAMVERSQYLYFANRSDAYDDPATLISERDISSIGAFARRYITEPTLFEIPRERITDIAAGYCFYLVIVASGALYTFGFNDKGQLGHNDRFMLEEPQRVMALENVHIVAAAAGQQHAVALSADGALYTWGGGVFGIGHGDLDDHLSPKRVIALDGIPIRKVSCGTFHTFCVANDGRVFSFGHGEYGQQGRGDIGGSGHGATRNLLTPTEFSLSTSADSTAAMAPIVDVVCGYLHTLLLLADGSLWSCGWGAHGVLGHGDKRQYVRPTRISAVEGERIVAAAAGWQHNIAVKEGAATFALNFEKVFTSGHHYDMVFLADRKPLRAHRVFVASRCAHIAALLAFSTRCPPHPLSSTTYNNLPVLEIPHARYIVLSALVNYLYTDHLKVAPFFLPEVESLAVRFRLPRLALLCRQQQRRIDKNIDNASQRFLVPPSSFAADMMQSVNQFATADVELVCADGAVVAAHRVVLSATSAHLKTLLMENAFEEANKRRVSLENSPIASDTMLTILQYLYCGQCHLDAQNALSVLQGADYLMIGDLKQVCEDVAERCLDADDIESLQSTLDIAVTLNAPRLAHYCRTNLALQVPSE